MFGFGLPELIILMIILAVPVLWISALVSAIKSDFPGNNKIIWILAIILVPFLGSILYFIIGRGQRIQQSLVKCGCGSLVDSNASFCTSCGVKMA
ncbi:PLDc N-terminal domain-containing protein [Oryzomonas rubra]|uniref:Cardiolipin synthase N-terminal domain-containing protein n=1 Tax=Oryzomonas rubra TaxID=2509454 RepID=A0A5A9XMD0_9BACT|nr:PLDc N-terminal domain-containing protein [Oryzomonas rubra]KAA0894287.1 hypothetical protein ET418_04870 [Oryzomonas rubra]